jgi:hypothetical protein
MQVLLDQFRDANQPPDTLYLRVPVRERGPE